jgi:uncharacterized sulfatase
MINTKNILLLTPLTIISACKPTHNKVADLSKIQFDYKPNILWLSIEDLDCTIAAYGDSTIPTPNMDRLADEGVVFDNAYTVAGVSAPSRSSIITGMYPTRMGTHNMRTNEIIPPKAMKCFTEYLREAGYYCTNNSKEDYNFETPIEAWDESSKSAHYRNRPKGAPFFAIFNHTLCHESRIWFMDWHHLLTNPNTVPVPAYYPQDNKIVRKDIARKYSNVTLVDRQIGIFMQELTNNGLLDSTIVVFWSDHGGPLPRQKRELYNSGIKVPMIIRFPGKQMGGTRVKDMVSLMDLGPTMMALAGIQKPEHMDGKIFIGPNKEKREYVFAARNRMDAQHDMQRAVCDGRFKYIRNYYPEKPFKQVLQYRLNMSMMQELNRLHSAGELEGAVKKWFRPEKPVEELYDTWNDPEELNNLASDDGAKKQLNKMRQVFDDWQKNTLDLGLLPEQCMHNIQKKTGLPVYNAINSKPEIYQQIRDIANKSLYPEKYKDALARALKDTNNAIKYWAIRGIGRLGKDGANVLPLLLKEKNGASGSVRASLAWTLCQIGAKEEGLQLFSQLLNDSPYYAKIMAINFAGDMGSEALSLKPALKKISETHDKLTTNAAKSALMKIN